MNYALVYERLIARAKSRQSIDGYAERHHVVPKCMGGDNRRENLVSLTAREHHVAHQLLVKLHPGVIGLTFAALAMCGNRRIGKRASRKYEWIRKRHADHQSRAQTGKTRPPHVGAAIRAALLGVPKTTEHRAKLSAAKMGQKPSEEAKRKLSARRGRVVSEETRQRISAANRGQPKPACRGNKSRSGMTNSAETRQKISLANSGKVHTPDWKLNIAKGQAGISDEIVRSIRSEYAARDLSQERLAAKYGIGQSHVSRIVQRKTYAWVV